MSRQINKAMILLYAVSTPEELESVQQLQDGNCYLCTDNFTYTGTLNGQSYTREFIQGEIITYTEEFGFYYPALQIPIQFRAWVADNFYNKRSIDKMILDSGVGKVKTNADDPKADYLINKFEDTPGIKVRRSENHKLKIILDTQVAPYIGENGNWFVTNRNTGETMDTGVKAAGVDGTSIHYVGEFELNAPYKFNDAVRYNKKIYVAESDIESAQQTPDQDTENWEFMIEDGAKGDKGDKGDTGVTPDISFSKPSVTQSTGEPDVTIEPAAGSTPENPKFDMTFSGIKGEKGDKGDQGDPGVDGTNFGYSNEYASYELMEADLENIEEGSYVIINAGQDNGKVYRKKNGDLQYVVNIVGPQGPQGEQGDTGATGNGISSVDDVPSQEDQGDNVVTLHFTNGDSYSFTVKNGSKGSPGKDFVIRKVYASISAMNADLNNPEVAVGEFVLINTSDVEDPDNAKLYVKKLSDDQLEWGYLTDLSGAQGIQGPPGADGTNGTDGATWYTSANDTMPDNPNLGDLHLNTVSGEIQKCTQKSGMITVWSIIGNIKGPQGTNGSNGSDGATWFASSSQPSGAKSGDLWLNTSNQNVYKYNGSSWGSAICNIKGATGSQGPQGADGADGADGVDGEDGATWYTGAGIPQSTQTSGKPGDLYLDTTTGNVYKYSPVSAWYLLCNIKGVDGFSKILLYETTTTNWSSFTDLTLNGTTAALGDMYDNAIDGYIILLKVTNTSSNESTTFKLSNTEYAGQQQYPAKKCYLTNVFEDSGYFVIEKMEVSDSNGRSMAYNSYDLPRIQYSTSIPSSFEPGTLYVL